MLKKWRKIQNTLRSTILMKPLLRCSRKKIRNSKRYNMNKILDKRNNLNINRRKRNNRMFHNYSKFRRKPIKLKTKKKIKQLSSLIFRRLLNQIKRLHLRNNKRLFKSQRSKKMISNGKQNIMKGFFWY